MAGKCNKDLCCLKTPCRLTWKRVVVADVALMWMIGLSKTGSKKSKTLSRKLDMKEILQGHNYSLRRTFYARTYEGLLELTVIRTFSFWTFCVAPKNYCTFSCMPEKNLFSCTPYCLLAFFFRHSCKCRLASWLTFGSQVGLTRAYLGCLLKHSEYLIMIRAERSQQ